MRVQYNQGTLGDFNTFMRSTGNIVMDTSHGIIKLAKEVRGDSADVVVEGSKPISYSNLAVYGTLAAIALLMVVKK